MLEFYRKNYISKNNFINIFDVIFAITVTIVGYIRLPGGNFFALWVILLIIVWIKAILTIFCMIKYRNAKEIE
ncbi:hypothetical protein [Anaerovorax odorimutans]|uniref:hypothetical protein n=1 Tax=Anaerovorax odorimutans TaxID=109327 RepID=UPI000422DEE6|nr:hypothetical protein [Anaerovorax odorimutans]